MPPSPPIVHVGTRKAPAVVGAGGATLPTAADLLECEILSPPRDHAVPTATNIDGATLQGKSLVQKIHTILAEPNYSSIISWNSAGTAVIIHDVDAFVETIMPAHFQQAKFDSFTRRMRRWGFRVVKQRSLSSTSSERRQSTSIEFSSEKFIRDQPDLSLLMKDERIVSKQFNFLDRSNVRKVDGVVEQNSHQRPTLGVCVHYPPSSRGGTMIPSSGVKQPIPVHYPPSSSMNTAQKQPEFQQSEMTPTMPKSNLDGGMNMTMSYGYPHNYSQEQQVTTNLHPFPINMTIPISPPRPYHGQDPYGYGAPAPQGFGFEPASYSGSPSSEQHRQHHIMSIMDAKASTTRQSATLMSSSSEESNELELLPVAKRK